MPRIARVYVVDYPHHVTQRGNNREDIFFDDEDRDLYLDTLRRYGRKWGLDIWAYCLMTNHVHILAVPRGEQSLAKGIGTTNLVYTQHINRKYARSGRLWQNRFFSTIVDSDAYLWAVARYIERNPVRSGVVAIPEDYRWSSCKAHIGGGSDPVLSEDAWLEGSSISEYGAYVKGEDKVTNDSIRKATSTGRPFGGKGFIRRIEGMLGRKLFKKRPGRPRERKQNDQ